MALADALVSVNIIGIEEAVTALRKWTSAVPVLQVELPHVVAAPVMDTVMIGFYELTPRDSGQLLELTDWRYEDVFPDVHISVFSEAANVRTGYNYAHARAYGYIKINGEPWVPPEDPPYPVQVIQNAQLPVISLGPKIMQIVGV